VNWTPSELDLLKECTALGFNAGQLKSLFGRSRDAIGGRRLRAGFSLPPRHVPEPEPRRIVMVADIQRAVANRFDVPEIEMTSARRHKPYARARQVAMYLSRDLTPQSLPSIGRLFGGRDHTTIMHGINVVETLRKSDADLNSTIDELRQELAVDNAPVPAFFNEAASA
jgi:hypothetical protein